MILSYAYCNVSVAPLYAEGAHRSEQISQLLFGEKVEILEIDANDWARIRCRWDGYEGWCKAGQLQIITYKEYRKPVRHVCSRNHDRLVAEDGDLWLPAGSELAPIKSAFFFHGSKHGKFKGKKHNLQQTIPGGKSLADAAKIYLHAPYLWGGRSIAGIDCSGLVQMAYKLNGISLMRDASQQALMGDTIDFLMEAKAGDLAFFDNSEGRITHVGMMLDSQTIIHATDTSGRVVIDKLDNGGIISVSLKRRTHNLRVVKRILV